MRLNPKYRYSCVCFSGYTGDGIDDCTLSGGPEVVTDGSFANWDSDNYNLPNNQGSFSSQGLSTTTHVGGYIQVSSSSSFTTSTGLSALEYVNGYFKYQSITSTSATNALSGLESLQEVRDYLKLYELRYVQTLSFITN